MPKVTLAFEFNSEDEARQFLNRAPVIGNITGAHDGKHEYVTHNVATENHAHAPKAATQEPDVQVAQQPTAQTEAAAEITSDDCVKAFSAYVGRGNGRNAMTGKKIMTDLNVASFKTATQEQRAALIQKYASE